jgi:hypothetical protein
MTFPLTFRLTFPLTFRLMTFPLTFRLVFSHTFHLPFHVVSTISRRFFRNEVVIVVIVTEIR